MAPDYHHGDLPHVLRAAAAEVITERGLGAFSLREVARRAGVSHAAPAHHFGDTQGLLTSLAVEAMDALAAVTRTAPEPGDDPIQALTASGKAYVNIALSHPAHCQVIFRNDVIDPLDPEYRRAGSGAYAVLTDRLEAVRDHLDADFDIHLAAKLCWTTLQGLLAIFDTMISLDESEDRIPFERNQLIEEFTRTIVGGLANGAIAGGSA